MRQNQENFISMASVTDKIMGDYNALWAANIPVGKIVANIREDIAAVNAAQQGGGEVSQGVTEDKELAAEAAIEKAVLLGGLGQAYALDNENNTLYRQLRVSENSLEKLPDEELTPALQLVHDTLNDIGAPLEDYGVDAPGLTAFQDSITAFAAIKSAPRQVIVRRKGHNATIPELLRHLRASFYKLDKLVKIWAATNPEFVRDYMNARIIIDLGIRHKTPPPAAPGA